MLTAQPATTLERPAGTILTGTPTAFDPIVGAAAARQHYGVDGTGMTVAVIDTGVDYNNPALGGGFGPNAKVIAGYNFATNTPDPMATDSQHGTAVAGLIGSDDPNHLGVAPGVKIVALRVTGSDNTASLSNIASALQWVVNNHAQYNITVVNMSLSDGGNYAQNWFAQDGGVGQQITNLIGQLKALNIPVVSATGNSFTGQQGEGFTSIVGGVISVTATDTSDHLLPDAQRLGAVTGMGTMTDLAAPGEGFVAPSGDSGYSSVDGTSFATPLVSGAVVLLQQIYQARFGTLPTVDQVTRWLEQGSDPIYDPVTGLTIGRLDIPKAAGLIPSAASSPAPPAAPAPTTISIPALQTTPGLTSTVTATPVSNVPASNTTPTSTDDDSQHGDDANQYGDDDSQHGRQPARRHGDDANQHGDDDSQHGDDDSQHGDDANQHGDDDSQHGDDANQHAADNQHAAHKHGDDANQHAADKHGDVIQHAVRCPCGRPPGDPGSIEL